MTTLLVIDGPNRGAVLDVDTTRGPFITLGPPTLDWDAPPESVVSHTAYCMHPITFAGTTFMVGTTGPYVAAAGREAAVSELLLTDAGRQVLAP